MLEIPARVAAAGSTAPNAACLIYAIFLADACPYAGSAALQERPQLPALFPAAAMAITNSAAAHLTLMFPACCDDA